MNNINQLLHTLQLLHTPNISIIDDKDKKNKVFFVYLFNPTSNPYKNSFYFQHSLLCCLASEDEETKEDVPNELKRENLDRVEQAFRKFDLDHDGYLSWQEFKQVDKYIDFTFFSYVFYS